MAQIVTHDGPRPMCFELRPLPSDQKGDRWQWTIYSHPDLAFLRDGQVAGLREKADRAARAAIWIMGGAVESLKES